MRVLRPDTDHPRLLGSWIGIRHDTQQRVVRRGGVAPAGPQVPKCEQQRAEAEKSVDAQVVSAFALSEAQLAQFAEALKKRLGRKVNLVAKIDQSIIGGAIVQAGDLVIDGSLTGQLNKLSHALLR